MKISELSDVQRQHLAWRIDHKTGTGLITGVGIARGEFGDLDLVDVFLRCGKSRRSALAHARKVATFEVGKKSA